jgi:WD40 repeat protein
MAQDNKPQLMIPTGHPQGIIQLEILPKKQILLSQSYNEIAVRMWDIKTGKLLRVITLPQQPKDISINHSTESVLFNFTIQQHLCTI